MARRTVKMLIPALAAALSACESPPPPTSTETTAAPPPAAEAPSHPGGGVIAPGSVETPLAEAEPEVVAAQHVLVAYKGATRAPKGITRSKDEAKKRAEEALAKARKGDDFSEVVKAYSDEPGAAERLGSLGKFKRDVMAKPFADAAFKLKVGEISDVVETEFGFHVIKRNQ